MKKLFSILLIAATLLLGACGKEKAETTTVATTSTPKSADMLNITSNNKSYGDCVSRYYAVLTAVKNKTQILEKEHNKQIEAQNPEKYFLDENYISTLFDPFVLADFSLTENFSPSLTEEKAKDLFAYKSNGDSIRFKSESGSSYSLSFVNENLLREYSVEYSAKDSFRYISSTETDETDTVNEMLEFSRSANTYYIQSKTSRLYVQFDGDGNIVYFCCSTLKNSSYGSGDSIYPEAEITKEWVTERNRDDYLSIHTYENGVLTHEDSSSGPWKTVTVYEGEYQNIFPLQ